MFNTLLSMFKNKPKKKPLYTKKQFTKYSNYKGDTYVYDSYSNQWLLWYLIASDVDDGDISEYDMIKDNDHDIMKDKTYNNFDWYIRDDIDDSSNYVKAEHNSKEVKLGCSDNTVVASTSNNYDSGTNYSSSSDSYSPSSYDSGSSSSFSSSDSGGGCF